MIDRRKFITSCAAGAAVLTTPALLRASVPGDDSAPGISMDTFRPLVGQRFRCMTDLGLRRGLVVYGGDEVRPLGRGIDLVPWQRVAAGAFELPL